MRTRVAYSVNTQGFAEYVYFSMKTASLNTRAKLSDPDLAHFKTPASMKKFALKESMENRLDMLTKLGKSFTVLLYADPIDVQYLDRGFGSKLEYEYMVEAIRDELKKGNHFVFGSRQIVQVAQVGASFASGSNYILDLDFHKVAEWADPGRYDRTDVDESQALQAYTDMSSMVSIMSAILANAEGLSGMSALQMRILMVFFQNRNKYITPDPVRKSIGGVDNFKAVSFGMAMLVKNGLIVPLVEKHEYTKNAFMITEKGIEVAMQFLKLIKTRMTREQS